MTSSARPVRNMSAADNATATAGPTERTSPTMRPANTPTASATPPASAVGRSCHRSPLGRATSPATVATLRTTGVRTRETMSATPRDGTSGPPTPATSSRHRRDSLAVIVDHGVQDFVDPDLGLPADRTIDLVERRDAPRHVLEVLLV